ncbi:MAG: TonB-dependent receptor [Bacteroidetes bacterium]|nr:TonB-dependent receptor [Bacteroidota bacterium]
MTPPTRTITRIPKETGTQGFEADFQWKFKKGYIDISYGFYSAANKNRLDEYQVPEKSQFLLGFPNQKISLNTVFRFYKNYSINPTIAWSGVKYGVVALDDNDEAIMGKYDQTLLLNIALKADDFITKGLTFSLGAFNLLDNNEYYLQPYNGGHAALPGASREITFSLSYKFFYK